MRNLIAIIALFLVTTLTASTAAAQRVERRQFHVSHGKLKSGDNDFRIWGIQVPGRGSTGPTEAEVVDIMDRICEAGGTTVCLDMFGFTPDGALSPEAAEAVRDFTDEASEHHWMGIIWHVFGPGAPTSPKARRATVRSVAKALHDNVKAIYWVDGPDAKALAATLKRRAPRFTVAGPDAEIAVVHTLADVVPGPVTLVASEAPDTPRPEVHFLLPDSLENYRRLDALLAYPEEALPWTPDNNGLSAEERAAGFISLFDGKTLDGWTFVGSNKDGFRVNDGVIEWVERGAYALQSHDRYGDFVFRCDWKIGEGVNSGIQFRTPRAGRASGVGFELQLFDDYGEPPDKGGTAAVYDVLPPLVNATKPAGEWNTLEVTFIGPQLTVVLNGITVQDLSFDDHDELRHRLRRGFVRLQDHGGYVAFRNLRVKEL